jgi:hypothetical protein
VQCLSSRAGSVPLLMQLSLTVAPASSSNFLVIVDSFAMVRKGTRLGAAAGISQTCIELRTATTG